MTIEIDGGIIAGGLATRMDGQDKGLQVYQGQPMVASIAAILRPFTRQLIINCNRNETAYQSYGDKLCSDVIEGYKGPLAGLHAILNESDADYLLVSPCDTPNLQTSYCERMLAELNQHLEQNPEAPALIAVKANERNHPLHILIHTSFKASLRNKLDAGDFKVMRWLEENKVQWIDFSDQAEAFQNINTLQDLKT